MQFYDPCGKCLVEIICEQTCPSKKDLWKTKKIVNEYTKCALIVFFGIVIVTGLMIVVVG